MKRSIRQTMTAPSAGVTPTQERFRQNGGVICENIQSEPRRGNPLKRYRAVWECPLDAYHARGILNRSEYRAGLRFHRAYYAVALCRKHDTHRPASREEASIGNSRIDKLLTLARKIVAPGDLGTVINICGHSKPAQFQRDLVFLKRGLGALVQRWHLAAHEVCEPRSDDRSSQSNAVRAH